MTTKQFDTVGDAIAARNERLQTEQASRGQAARQYKNVRDANKAVPVLAPDKIAAKYHDRRRVGKTAKDHASGSWKQRLENRAARSEK